VGGVDRCGGVVYKPFHAERNEARRCGDDDEAGVELLLLWFRFFE
jgi:hypothetical protein